MVSRETLERVVLSALIRGDFTPVQVGYGVEVEDFSSAPHRTIASAIFPLLDGLWKACDRVTAVATRLAEGGELDRVGGVAELALLATGDPPVMEVRQATEELIRRTDLERLAEAAARIATAANSSRNPERAWLAAEEALLQAIPRTARWDTPTPIRRLAYPAVERIERGQAYLRSRLAGTDIVFPSGIHGLDRDFGGLAGPDLTLVLAPRGWGRALALQAALAGARVAGRRVLVASDTPRQEFTSEALMWLEGFDDACRARRELTAKELGRAAEAALKLRALPITYVEPATATRIAAAIRSEVDVQRPRLLVIDEVRALGRGYRGALLRLRQACRADGTRLLVAMETDRTVAVLDPFFPDLRSRRVAELATRIVRVLPGTRRLATLQVWDRSLDLEFTIRVEISPLNQRITDIAAGGGGA